MMLSLLAGEAGDDVWFDLMDVRRVVCLTVRNPRT